jgi:hypothetical protein
MILIALAAMLMLTGCMERSVNDKTPVTINGAWRVTGVVPLDTRSPDVDREENDSCVSGRILISDTSFIVRDRNGNVTFDERDTAYSEIDSYTGCLCSMRHGFGYRFSRVAKYEADSAGGEDERFLNVVYGMNKTRFVPVYRSNYGYDNCGDQDSIDFYLVPDGLIIHDCGRLVMLGRDSVKGN